MQFRRAGFVQGKVPRIIWHLKIQDHQLLVLACTSTCIQNLFVNIKNYSDRGITWALNFFSDDGGGRF